MKNNIISIFLAISILFMGCYFCKQHIYMKVNLEKADNRLCPVFYLSHDKDYLSPVRVGIFRLFEEKENRDERVLVVMAHQDNVSKIGFCWSDEDIWKSMGVDKTQDGEHILRSEKKIKYDVVYRSECRLGPDAPACGLIRFKIVKDGQGKDKLIILDKRKRK